MAGFKELLGQDILELHLKPPEPPNEIQVPDLPRISIRLRDEEPFAALDDLEVTPEVVTSDGVMVLRCAKANDVVLALLYLDFRDERLKINIEAGFAVYDDKTVVAAKYAAEICLFKGKYFLNGALELWDSDRDILLGRCDPYLPRNIMPSGTWQNFKRHSERFEEIAKERQVSAQSDIPTPGKGGKQSDSTVDETD